MIPYHDENETQRTAYVALTLIALNVLAWLLVQGAGSPAPLIRSVCELGLIPGELTASLPPGTSFPIAEGMTCTTDPGRQVQNVFTSMFLHGSWMHLIGNMWFLWIFGKNVEDAMGHLRFAAFYLLCGAAAAGLQIAVNPASGVPMVGASGAIGGVMGAYVVLYPRVRVEMLLWLGFYVTSFTLPAFWMLAYWFLIQLLGGVGALGGTGGGVAFWAHVGGFAAGALLVPLFRDPVLLARHPHHGWRQRPGHDGERWRR